MTHEDKGVATWHHGVVAQWWAEFVDDGPEVDYFVGAVREHGGPALDLGCGAGRLMLPMLAAGLEVDGCDVSSDMLARCRDRCAAAGFAPQLVAQAMHELDLPRRYATVFVCGGLGLGGDLARDHEALRRIRRHLQPGGVLLLDVHVPYEDPDTWRLWLPRARAVLPEGWGEWPERRRASDGTDLALLSRVVDLDPVTQVITREINARRWRDDRLVADEVHVLKERFYFHDEVVLMLEQAGFVDVRVTSDYTSAGAAPHADVLVFAARLGGANGWT